MGRVRDKMMQLAKDEAFSALVGNCSSLSQLVGIANIRDTIHEIVVSIGVLCDFMDKFTGTPFYFSSLLSEQNELIESAPGSSPSHVTCLLPYLKSSSQAQIGVSRP